MPFRAALTAVLDVGVRHHRRGPHHDAVTAVEHGVRRPGHAVGRLVDDHRRIDLVEPLGHVVFVALRTARHRSPPAVADSVDTAAIAVASATLRRLTPSDDVVATRPISPCISIFPSMSSDHEPVGSDVGTPSCDTQPDRTGFRIGERENDRARRRVPCPTPRRGVPARPHRHRPRAPGPRRRRHRDRPRTTRFRRRPGTRAPRRTVDAPRVPAVSALDVSSSSASSSSTSAHVSKPSARSMIPTGKGSSPHASPRAASNSRSASDINSSGSWPASSLTCSPPFRVDPVHPNPAS